MLNYLYCGNTEEPQAETRAPLCQVLAKGCFLPHYNYNLNKLNRCSFYVKAGLRVQNSLSREATEASWPEICGT